MFFLGSSAEQVEAGTAEEVAATRFDRITATAREMPRGDACSGGHFGKLKDQRSRPREVASGFGAGSRADDGQTRSNRLLPACRHSSARFCETVRTR